MDGVSRREAQRGTLREVLQRLGLTMSWLYIYREKVTVLLVQVPEHHPEMEAG